MNYEINISALSSSSGEIFTARKNLIIICTRSCQLTKKSKILSYTIGTYQLFVIHIQIIKMI